MEKFSCNNCGACCTRFGVHRALPFFEWEIAILKKEAKKRKINLDLRPINILFDENSKIYFFPQYGMFNEPCPFLKENKCLIYEERPYVCRMFPLIKTPFIETEEINYGWFCICPHFNLEEFVRKTKEKKLKEENLKELFRESFGECNEICEKATRIRNEIDGIMKKLIEEGKVKLRGVEENEKVSKPVPILEFLIKIKVINPKEKRDMIKNFK